MLLPCMSKNEAVWLSDSQASTQRPILTIREQFVDQSVCAVQPVVAIGQKRGGGSTTSIEGVHRWTQMSRTEQATVGFLVCGRDSFD